MDAHLNLYENTHWFSSNNTIELTTYGRTTVLNAFGLSTKTDILKEISVLSISLVHIKDNIVIDSESVILMNDKSSTRNLAWLECVKSLYIRQIENGIINDNLFKFKKIRNGS